MEAVVVHHEEVAKEEEDVQEPVAEKEVQKVEEKPVEKPVEKPAEVPQEKEETIEEAVNRRRRERAERLAALDAAPAAKEPEPVKQEPEPEPVPEPVAEPVAEPVQEEAVKEPEPVVVEESASAKKTPPVVAPKPPKNVATAALAPPAAEPVPVVEDDITRRRRERAARLAAIEAEAAKSAPPPKEEQPPAEDDLTRRRRERAERLAALDAEANAAATAATAAAAAAEKPKTPKASAAVATPAAAPDATAMPPKAAPSKKETPEEEALRRRRERAARMKEIESGGVPASSTTTAATAEPEAAAPAPAPAPVEAPSASSASAPSADNYASEVARRREERRKRLAELDAVPSTAAAAAAAAAPAPVAAAPVGEEASAAPADSLQDLIDAEEKLEEEVSKVETQFELESDDAREKSVSLTKELLKVRREERRRTAEVTVQAVTPAIHGSPSSDKCALCTKRVRARLCFVNIKRCFEKKKIFANDFLDVEGTVFHKNCFKCTKCNTVLKQSQYKIVQNAYYCTLHGRQLERKLGIESATSASTAASETTSSSATSTPESSSRTKRASLANAEEAVKPKPSKEKEQRKSMGGIVDQFNKSAYACLMSLFFFSNVFFPSFLSCSPATSTKAATPVKSSKPSGKEALLEWCKNATAFYPGVSVSNFNRSWHDGLAFAALIHKYKPDMIDYDAVLDMNIHDRIKTAFKAADVLGISQLLDVEDIADYEKPDEFSVQKYIFFLIFERNFLFLFLFLFAGHDISL